MGRENKKIPKRDPEIEAFFNEDSEDDSNVSGEMELDEIEESPRKRKTLTSIIGEMAKKTELEVANTSNILEEKEKRIELYKMSPAEMDFHIRQLEAELFELTQLEARELSRSTHLRIIANTRKRVFK